MAFDPCQHQVTQLLLNLATLLRKKDNQPEMKHATKLLEWLREHYGNELGLPAVPRIGSRSIDHLPAPWEIKDEKGEPYIKRAKCPKCGEEKVYVLATICTSCEDYKKGFRTEWRCLNPQCGFRELSKRSYTSYLDEYAPDWKSGTKKDLGIPTSTDKGLK